MSDTQAPDNRGAAGAITLKQIRAATKAGDPLLLRSVAARAQAGDADARVVILGAQCWAAFSAPGAITPVFDALSAGWLGREPAAAPAAQSDSAAVAVPDALWEAVEELLADAEQGFDAGTITARVAALGGLTAPEFGELAEAAARQHPGAAEPLLQAVPEMIRLESIADAPAGSLASALHRMLVDNGYDAEVLDRDAIGLTALPPALRFLNTRILQMHDVWHLAAGYETTALHEIAISAFQLAQFGHNYSAMFLAVVGLISGIRTPEGFALLQQTVYEAWSHGRSTPPLMDVAWEDCWREPLEQIREEQGIEPFRGSFPADLLEQLAATPAA